MKILKPGKVEMHKLTCPKCGCVFVASPAETEENECGVWAICPQDGFGYNFRVCLDTSEPYEEPTEEPTQDVEDDRKRLQDLICEWETCHFGGIPAAAQFFLEHGVTFREG